jgi:hypothetical protein
MLVEPMKVRFDELSCTWFITVETQRNLPPQLFWAHRSAFLDNLSGNPASCPVEHGKALRKLLPRREPVDSLLVAVLNGDRDRGHTLLEEKPGENHRLWPERQTT